MTDKEELKEILFQKIGNLWYAFVEEDDDIIYAPLPAGVDPRSAKFEFYQLIEERLEAAKNFKRSNFEGVA